MHQTWARRGVQPLILTTGQRNTQKILGAVNLYSPRFHFRHEQVFNGETYTRFLNNLAQTYRKREVFLIHDNAAYHKAPEVKEWLSRHGDRFHLEPLPPYSPDFNAVERIWHHVRLNATHNHYFPTKEEFVGTLDATLNSVHCNPEQIAGYLVPFL